jgi:hypothetical protein
MSTITPAVTHVSVGSSSAPDASTAGQQAARIAITRLDNRRAGCAIVFGSSWYDQEALLRGAAGVLKNVPMVGGSTAGEITAEGPRSHSCVVLAFAYDDVVVSVGVGPELDVNPRLAGYQAAQQAVRQFQGKPRNGFLFFGDGLVTGYAEALLGIQEVLGTSSLVSGALMGDDLQFTRTHQYANGQLHHHALAGLLFGGACQLGIGMEHGFSPISKPRQISKAKLNILSELDGKPALSVYEEYFGEAATTAAQEGGLTRWLVAYPLGIQQDNGRQFLLRNVMSFGPNGSVVCSGEVQEGSWVQLMIGSKELALEAATAAALAAVRPLRSVRCVLVFDSVLRKRLLGQDTATEIQRIRQAVGLSVPLAGCYTYAEHAPLGGSAPYGQSSLQTGACLVVAIGQ